MEVMDLEADDGKVLQEAPEPQGGAPTIASVLNQASAMIEIARRDRERLSMLQDQLDASENPKGGSDGSPEGDLPP